MLLFMSLYNKCNCSEKRYKAVIIIYKPLKKYFEFPHDISEYMSCFGHSNYRTF